MFSNSTTMITRKQLFLTLGIGSGLFLALFATLVIHIALVTKNKTNDSRNRQLSRIDFVNDITAKDAAHIKQLVLSLPGVDGAFVNEQSNILVFSHHPDQQNANIITAALTKVTGLQAKRYTVNENDLKNGCPAGYEKSTISKLALAVAKKL